MGQPSSPSGTSSRGQWIALTAAFLGWMFDGLEMGLFPLVAKSAMTDLLPSTDQPNVGRWIAADHGCVPDWSGKRRRVVRLARRPDRCVQAMSLSVFTYAIFSGLCGFATEAWHLAVLRFIASLGMGGEWSLGVALIMEVWPNRSRAWLAGLIGAAANFGYMLIAAVAVVLKELAPDTSWRTLMFCGAAPAFLTLLIQFYVPESQRWQQEKSRGVTSHWQTRDLFGVLIGTASALGLIALWSISLHWTIRVLAPSWRCFSSPSVISIRFSLISAGSSKAAG